MDPLAEGKSSLPWPIALLFVGSAAVAAALLRLSWHKPLVAAGLLCGALAYLASRWAARWRMRRLLLAGDVRRVLSRWSRSFSRVPNAETMAPLLTATAFAAYGWVGQARAALAAAARGPAWEAALEHRLFLDTLLLTFEGDRDGALEQAGRLERLPLPPAGPEVRGRMHTLRVAVGAFARAFAHRSREGDREALEHASNASPLVFWAMRYAAAVIAIDEGSYVRAQNLLASAPRWPAESTFRAFHDEILAQIPAQAA